jgi:hypothetical protein
VLAELPGPYYTIARIEQLLKIWHELEALVESPTSARGLTSSRPTPTDPKVGARQKGYPGDPMRWADVRSDLVRAWRELPIGSLERRAIAGRMDGQKFGEMAQINRCSKTTILEAYRAALKRMMETLEGIEPETTKEPGCEMLAPGLSTC